MMRIFIAFLLLLTTNQLIAQDDLLNQLEKEDSKSKSDVIGTFHGTRLINGHSVETKPRGALEFIITHRFGPLSEKGYELWGLDQSVIRIGLEYGITDKLGVGVGRSSDDKTFDYYVKYKLLQQQENGVPITVTALGTAAFKASLNKDSTLKTGDKMAYVAQVLIARKFSSRVSFQVMPVFLKRQHVGNETTETKNLFALGLGGRVKITKSMALVGEYYPRLNEKSGNPYNDSIGFGVEFETGGHVFQLVFTNSYGMVERAFLAESYDDYFDGGVHFGFNITRTFQLARNK